MTERRILIGVGNPLRHDDGVGPAVVQRLAALGLSPSVTIMAHHGEGLSLLETWQDYAAVVVIDATRSDQPPGTVQRFEVGRATSLPTGLFNYSSHLFGLAEAVALAQSLDRLPASLVIYGIEGADFTYGEGLTPPVLASVALVAKQIKTELDFSDQCA